MTSFPDGDSNMSAFSGVPTQAILSFRKFFERSWFKRCWTLQEIGLARRATLICDGDKLDWDIFFSVICWINKYHPLDVIHLTLPTQELATSVGLYMASEKGLTSSQYQPDFLDILSATRSRECTDPHDRLYAFLGHPTASDEEGPLIRPSYIRNTWIVFYEFALSYLQRTQNLRILSAIDHGERLLPPTFPLSWVPWWNTSPCLCNFGLSSLYGASAGSENFQSVWLGGVPLADLEIDEVLEDSPLFEWYDLMIPSSTSLEDLEFVQRRAFNSIMDYQFAKMMSNPLTPGFTPDDVLDSFQPREAKLTVRGLILDKVKLTCPVLDREDFATHSFSHDKDPAGHIVERLYHEIHEERFPSRYEDSLLALSLTLAAGMHNSELIKDFDAHKESFDAYRHAAQNSRTRILKEGEQREWLKGVADGAPMAVDSAPDSAPLLSGTLWRRFMIDAAQACHGRRFFPTKSGYFGLGPAAIGGWYNTEMLCCIFFGASVPFILQKHGNIYRLVGEAYVHGVMSGEAIEMWKRGELEKVNFQLF
ncbi:hypothetical protein N431DRAFT_419932 [Stipitochalara longipes BDJ]|nr:hypothetical protein N431DRAFT_419932 [Stipitochalara longipes BDJ]